MGLTHVDATVTGATGRSQKLELLVDSGASYSLLPAKVWKALKFPTTMRYWASSPWKSSAWSSTPSNANSAP